MLQIVGTEQIEIRRLKRPAFLIETDGFQSCRVRAGKQGNVLINSTECIVYKLHI